MSKSLMLSWAFYYLAAYILDYCDLIISTYTTSASVVSWVLVFTFRWHAYRDLVD